MINEICVRADDNFSDEGTWMRMTVVLFNVKTRVESVIRVRNQRLRDIINALKAQAGWPDHIAELLTLGEI